MDEEETQMADVPEQVLGEREGLTNESTTSLAQGQVEAFDMIRLPLSFAARMVLLFRENLPISAVEVAGARLGLVARWHLVPQRLARQLIALAIVPRHHLRRSSTQRDPDPHLVFLAAIARLEEKATRRRHPQLLGRCRRGACGGRLCAFSGSRAARCGSGRGSSAAGTTACTRLVQPTHATCGSCGRRRCLRDSLKRVG